MRSFLLIQQQICNCFNAHREIAFDLDLDIHSCNAPDKFQEGVEVSVGNWDGNGDWIPLHYYTINNEDSDSIHFGELNFTSKTVKIRGYTVPYSIQYDDMPLSATLTVCGEKMLRDGVQIRWLQTTRIFDIAPYNAPVDSLALDNISISVVYCKEHRSLRYACQFSISHNYYYVPLLCLLGIH